VSTTASESLPSNDPATVVTERPSEVPPAAPETSAQRVAPAAPGPSGVMRGSSVPPVGLGLLGTLTVLVGAWGGIVPFVGPIFGFSADASSSWYWNLSHALLWLVPGAVAVVCGLSMLGHVPRALAGLGRPGTVAAGFIVALCGAWFVIGPSAWQVLEHSSVYTGATPLRELAFHIGYSFGPGLLLAVFGGFAMAWGSRARRLVPTPVHAL
jgi:hypothetical protein